MGHPVDRNCARRMREKEAREKRKEVREKMRVSPWLIAFFFLLLLSFKDNTNILITTGVQSWGKRGGNNIFRLSLKITFDHNLIFDQLKPKIISVYGQVFLPFDTKKTLYAALFDFSN